MGVVVRERERQGRRERNRRVCVMLWLCVVCIVLFSQLLVGQQPPRTRPAQQLPAAVVGTAGAAAHAPGPERPHPRL